MLKKLILSNKIIFIFISIFILFCGCNYMISQNSSTLVFNLTHRDTILEEDLNGDKRKDNILIKYTEDSILAQVNLNKNKTFSLDYSKDLPTLGEYCSYWPIRITTLDISRDNSKEIFLQSSFHNKPIQHIFTWDGSKYINIFSSNNNLLGFIDSNNSKTPKVVVGNYQGGDITFSKYIYKRGSLEEILVNSPEILASSDTISSLIGLIQTLPNQYISVPNYFYSQISGSDLESLFRLANGTNKFIFQDGYFTDLAWQNNGTITCSNWILNFKAINISDQSSITNMTINLMINKYNDADYPYKITSFNIYQ